MSGGSGSSGNKGSGNSSEQPDNDDEDHVFEEEDFEEESSVVELSSEEVDRCTNEVISDPKTKKAFLKRLKEITEKKRKKAGFVYMVTFLMEIDGVKVEMVKIGQTTREVVSRISERQPFTLLQIISVVYVKVEDVKVEKLTHYVLDNRRIRAESGRRIEVFYGDARDKAKSLMQLFAYIQSDDSTRGKVIRLSKDTLEQLKKNEAKRTKVYILNPKA